MKSVNSLYKEVDKIDELNKEAFRELLTLAITESFFLFDGKFYQQTDGVAMGSPLGPILANAFYGVPTNISECILWGPH